MNRARAAKVKALHEHLAKECEMMQIERFTYRGRNLAVDPTLTIMMAHAAIDWFEKQKKNKE